jgi:DNA-binding NarL/FixJ family response regulator
VRIVIVDRFPFVAEALRQALDGRNGTHVAGIFADDSQATIRAVAGLHPDLLLVEITTGGPELIRKLRQAVGEATIAALSAHASPDEEAEARESGANAYIVKADGLERLRARISGLRTATG